MFKKRLASLWISNTNGGASGRFEQLKEIAVDYAFALKIANRAGA